MVNAPGVGQSFGTELLGMTLNTSRLRTPPDRPSHIMPGPVLCFFSLSLALQGSKFRLHISEYGNTEPKGRQRTTRFVSAVAMLVCATRDVNLQQ